jgi:hypothetical protein
VKLDQYKTFVDELCQRHWAFGFFLDFRGYVQHNGLPVNNYSKQVGTSSVSISVTQEAEALLRESRRWEKSNLAPTHGTLDLVALLQEFHLVMMNTYVRYVIGTLFPELLPAAQFYGTLTEEVKKVNPAYRMVFHLGDPKVVHEEHLLTANLQLEFPPNDVLKDIRN